MTLNVDVQAPNERVASLERRLGRVRVLALLAFLVGAGALAWTLLERKADLIEGRLWVARDAEGRLRAMFGVSADGVGMTMYDSTGQMRLDVGIAPGGVPGLLLLSPKGEPVATINLIEGRVPAIRLVNIAESVRVEVVPRAQGEVMEVRPPRRPDTMIARRPKD